MTDNKPEAEGLYRIIDGQYDVWLDESKSFFHPGEQLAFHGGYRSVMDSLDEIFREVRFAAWAEGRVAGVEDGFEEMALSHSFESPNPYAPPQSTLIEQRCGACGWTTASPHITETTEIDAHIKAEHAVRPR